jgi:hypothetical protein
MIKGCALATVTVSITTIPSCSRRSEATSYKLVVRQASQSVKGTQTRESDGWADRERAGHGEVGFMVADTWFGENLKFEFSGGGFGVQVGALAARIPNEDEGALNL